MIQTTLTIWDILIISILDALIAVAVVLVITRYFTAKATKEMIIDALIDPDEDTAQALATLTLTLGTGLGGMLAIGASPNCPAGVEPATYQNCQIMAGSLKSGFDSLMKSAGGGAIGGMKPPSFNQMLKFGFLDMLTGGKMTASMQKLGGQMTNPENVVQEATKSINIKENPFRKRT